MTLPIALMFLVIGVAAALATAGMVAVVLVDRAERGKHLDGGTPK